MGALFVSRLSCILSTILLHHLFLSSIIIISEKIYSLCNIPNFFLLKVKTRKNHKKCIFVVSFWIESRKKKEWTWLWPRRVHRCALLYRQLIGDIYTAKRWWWQWWLAFLKNFGSYHYHHNSVIECRSHSRWNNKTGSLCLRRKQRWCDVFDDDDDDYMRLPISDDVRIVFMLCFCCRSWSFQ